MGKIIKKIKENLMSKKSHAITAAMLLGGAATGYMHYRKKQQETYSRYDEIPRGYASKEITPGCLILEGGSLRGLYTAGVLDALMLSDLNFQTTIGVSAGSMMGFGYVAGQIGRAARFNLANRNNIHYVGLGAEIENKSPFNFDFAFDDQNTDEPFDHETFSNKDRDFYAVATDCTEGKARYFSKNDCSDIFAAIRASSSLPVASVMVDVGGARCLDGGCTDPIPVQWALDQGFEKIVVVRTREKTFRKGDKDKKEAFLIEKAYRDYPAFIDVMKRQHETYNAECDLVDELEKEGRIYVFAPEFPVTVSRLEGDLEKLGNLYFEGLDETLNHKDAILQYLESH